MKNSYPKIFVPHTFKLAQYPVLQMQVQQHSTTKYSIPYTRENILTVFHQALEDWLDRQLDLLNKLLFLYKLHNFLSYIFALQTYNCILYSTANFCPNILHSDVICNFHHNKNQYLQIPKDLEKGEKIVKLLHR